MAFITSLVYENVHNVSELLERISGYRDALKERLLKKISSSSEICDVSQEIADVMECGIKNCEEQRRSLYKEANALIESQVGKDVLVLERIHSKTYKTIYEAFLCAEENKVKEMAQGFVLETQQKALAIKKMSEIVSYSLFRQHMVEVLTKVEVKESVDSLERSVKNLSSSISESAEDVYMSYVMMKDKSEESVDNLDCE